jgi:dipeptidyl aminopeptidase/acylaminoacyl peptidase
MFKYFLSIAALCAAIFLFSLAASAQLPALIDREVFFGNPEYAGAQISPDGKYISFIKPFKDVRNVWVKGVNEPFSAARPLTNETKRPISGYFWSRDGKYILFTKDKDGDENFNVYAVNPTEAVASGAEVPTAKNLTDAKGIRAFIYSVPRSEPDYIYVGINERDKSWHDLYKVQISTGTKTLLRENKDRLTGWVFDNKDQLRLATRSTDAGDTEILRVDGDKFTRIYTCGIFENCSPIRFNKDDKRFYMVSDKGDTRNFQQLVLFDPDSMKEDFVEEDPLKRVDFGGANFSEVTKELIATTYEDDRERIYWKDKGYEADYKWLQSKLPNKEIGLGSSNKDETLFIVSAYSDTEPGETYLFDRKAKKLTLQYKVREKLPREALAPMKAIRYKSSDGLEIPAYLTLPKGVEGKNLPLLVVPHGGPWGRDSWGYNAFAQFFANRGYAVLQPNFRASTGYGKKYLDAGNLQWGDKMQDDITWGVKYLIDQGIADPKKVGIMGGSYGGYATLAGVTFTPDLYAAAVAYVAPSNLSTLLKSIPPYWEAGRQIFYKRMGDPNTPEGKAQLDRQSPLFSVNKIKTPLMVVQGANDPRVNKREADQIVIALRERNYPVEYLLADDEGHGFARPVNNMALFAEAEKFLAKYLGGRYQESMTPEVAKRLKELTVDIKTVSLPVAVNMNAAPAVSVSGKWNMTADAGGQSIDIILDLKQEGAGFNGSMSSMLGAGTIEDGKVSGNNVTCSVKADVQGQAMTLALEGKIEGDKMTGTLTAPGLPIIPFTAAKAK